MAQHDCIFCKIIAQEIPSTIVAENDDVLVVKDLAPKAPLHYLILSKKHIKNIATLTSDELPIAAKMIGMAQELSTKLSGSQSFRLIANNGADSGQSVFHLHMHFLSGKKMLDF